jgi:hypothetical protein
MHLQIITMLTLEKILTMLADVDSVAWSVCNHRKEMVSVLPWTALSQVMENWRVDFAISIYSTCVK